MTATEVLEQKGNPPSVGTDLLYNVSEQDETFYKLAFILCV